MCSSRGDTTVIAINGFFGRRMADIARRCGADVHTLEFPLGTPVDPDVVEEELKRHAHVKLLGVVHGETSTGVLSDLQSLVAVAHPPRCPHHRRHRILPWRA